MAPTDEELAEDQRRFRRLRRSGQAADFEMAKLYALARGKDRTYMAADYQAYRERLAAIVAKYRLGGPTPEDGGD